ncbi:MAG: MFS transporter [Gammaproteobacteria bacterium]
MLYSALGHAYFHMFTAFYFVIVLTLEIEWQRPYHELVNLWTLGALLVGVFALLAGYLADRWSAPGMLVVFFLGMGACSVAAGYAAGPLGMLLALAGIGLFAAIYHPVGIPLVIRNSGARQGAALAFNGVFGSLGAAMAGAVTGLLLERGGSYLAFVLPGVVVMLTGVAMLAGLARARARDLRAPTPPPSPSPPRWAPQVTPLLLLLFCLSAAGLVYHATQTVMPKVFSLRLESGGAAIKTVGFYVALVYVIGGLFQFIGGALADRYNLKLVYLCQFVAHALLLALAARAGGAYLVVVLCAASALGAGALPAENMLLARYTPRKHHGLVFGLKFVLFFSSGPLGIALVAWVNRHTGQFVWVFFLLALAAALVCLSALALPRNTPPASAAAAA